jgi:hypothetical protein
MKAVLPGYDKYAAVMSNETRGYVQAPPERKVVVIDVIPTVLKGATPTTDLVKIPLELTEREALGIDDAADLEASSDPEDE